MAYFSARPVGSAKQLPVQKDAGTDADLARQVYEVRDVAAASEGPFRKSTQVRFVLDDRGHRSREQALEFLLKQIPDLDLAPVDFRGDQERTVLVDHTRHSERHAQNLFRSRSGPFDGLKYQDLQGTDRIRRCEFPDVDVFSEEGT